MAKEERRRERAARTEERRQLAEAERAKSYVQLEEHEWCVASAWLRQEERKPEMYVPQVTLTRTLTRTRTLTITII